ncbi:SDR family oxidoreductase [Allorhizobium taibaishanense]|uniref:NAD(P)-dependent dehydrogenase (Short-subunit alcohol dehydrogenase family) n=1 Tax=Allorhizobium taibaishanense TaxID=887144 RepID=A0A1Q9A9D2_9HYPH|nr:SDR family oxidoreductase [Allorhizobium taibaishanense]MBB4009782.1 NAD(P)-dependent dehydrogenase (short-subunit alcohol dehydrogenase family) [Allorhizobium taibaishanense]OLP51434.1 short-chain dehydrogenase [Allorhizobium taibaishanense]
MRLEGKTALVTGATSGIGLATARLLAKEGARVAVTGRDKARLKEVEAELGQGALALKVDVRSAADMQDMSRRIQAAFDGLDIFFANAGVAFGTPLSATDEARYDELMDTNVKGVFLSMQAVSPILREGASVILSTSWLNEVGTPGLSMLSASKAAVRSLARTWSAELLDRKIRVNAVSPGAIDTPIHGRTVTEEVQATKDRIAGNIPLKHLGQPEDIAQAVLFLASDASRYMLGAELVVDGGFAQL